MQGERKNKEREDPSPSQKRKTQSGSQRGQRNKIVSFAKLSTWVKVND
jgi:hypothetical protein